MEDRCHPGSLATLGGAAFDRWLPDASGVPLGAEIAAPSRQTGYDLSGPAGESGDWNGVRVDPVTTASQPEDGAVRVGRPDNPLAFGGLDDLQLPTGGSVPFTIQPPSGQPDGVPLGGAAEAPAAGVSAPIRVPTPAPVAEALTPPSAALPGPSVAAGHPQAASAPQPLIPRPFVYLLIGDRVWQDDNANGQQDAGEPGVAGAAVELLSGGAPVATTTTDAGGAYQFSGVEDTLEGTAYGPVYRGQTYKVHFIAPTGTAITTQTAPGVPANLDSDADQTTGVTGDISPIEH